MKQQLLLRPVGLLLLVLAEGLAIGAASDELLEWVASNAGFVSLSSQVQSLLLLLQPLDLGDEFTSGKIACMRPL